MSPFAATSLRLVGGITPTSCSPSTRPTPAAATPRVARPSCLLKNGYTRSYTHMQQSYRCESRFEFARRLLPSAQASSRPTRQWVRAAAAATQAPTEPQFLRLPPEIVEAGGLVVADQPDEGKAQLADLLERGFMPVNLETPGLRILNIDPPIFTVPGFLSEQECDNLVNGALDAEQQQPGTMAQSAVGNSSGGANEGGNIRTSSTLGFTSTKLQQFPHLNEPLEVLLTKAQELQPSVGSNLVRSMKDGFKKPESMVGNWAVEQPQVARYQPGQHFLTHLDAFPANVVSQKGYQRKSTLLVYLNDVSEGGGTFFDMMDLRVKPVKGMALLFFPGFKNGMPDQRLPHTAEDAVDEKWVSQLWTVEGTKLQWPPKGALVEEKASRSKSKPAKSSRGKKQGPKSKKKKGKK